MEMKRRISSLNILRVSTYVLCFTEMLSLLMHCFGAVCAVQCREKDSCSFLLQCKIFLCSSLQCNARWFCTVTALLFITMQNDGLVGQVLHDRLSRGVTQPLFIHLQFGYSSSYKSGIIVIIYYQK